MINQIKKRIGNGLQTCCWEHQWIGDSPFSESFVRLYQVSTNKKALVAAMDLLSNKCHGIGNGEDNSLFGNTNS